MSNVTISLDNHTVYPGDVVRGKGICHFRSSKEVRKIRIRLRGSESTRWTGTESYYDATAKKTKTRTVTYHASRDILLRDYIVHGEGTLNIGEHVYPFEFVLPEDLPSSFQHTYGRIRFTLKLTVDRPWKMDYESEHDITIISPIKLERLSASLRQPVELSDDKTVCCCCCASGPIELDVNLEKRGFAIGENAGIKVYCSNLSNVNVESIIAEIKMISTFKAESPSTQYKNDSELVTTSHNSGVGAHGEKTFNLSLQIPPSTVVPNFTGCDLFKFETVLKVTAVVAGCHTDLDVLTEVALGHVPYPVVTPFTAPQEQMAPPYPINEIQPMPMPMPSYESAAGVTVGVVPPYPVPAYYPGPSAPHEIGHPSAPSNLPFGEEPTDSETGKSSAYELPPPSYDEASKNF